MKEITNNQLENIVLFDKLEQENKNLKSDLAYERTMLDNVKAEYDVLQEINEKLNERIKELEERLDNKEKVNKQLREELGKLVMKQ